MTKNDGVSTESHSKSKIFLSLSFLVCLLLWYSIETIEYENGSLCLNTNQNLHESQLLKRTVAGSVAEGTAAGLSHHHNKDGEEEGRVITVAGRNLTCLPSYSSYFRNILLVIQFTVRTGELEKEVEDLYSCFFPHIKRYTYCDPNTETNGMTCIPDPTPDYTANHPGFEYSASWFQYDFMADALEKNPGFEGYIFIQEDVIMNFWNFPARHDFKKVWRALMFADPDPQFWHAHKNLSMINVPPIANVVLGSSLFPQEKNIAFVDGFTEEQRQRIWRANSATGEPYTIRITNCDCYYIPAKYREAIIHQFKRAREHNVMQEVAIPMVFDALLENDEYEEEPAAHLSRITDSVEKIALYDPCWDYYHKVKTSIRREWEWMVDTIFRYGPMTGQWDCLDSGKDGLTSYFRIRDNYP